LTRFWWQLSVDVQVPLRLVFDNKEDVGDPITVIYKAGDDLRQDALTLQLIRVMDTVRPLRPAPWRPLVYIGWVPSSSPLCWPAAVEGRRVGPAAHHLWCHGHRREGNGLVHSTFVPFLSVISHFLRPHTHHRTHAHQHQEGIIEAVLNSTTVAEIAKEAGGATAVFNPQTISNWLKQQNPDGTSARRLTGCVHSNSSHVLCVWRPLQTPSTPWP
jgi:hypothetical protein